MSRYSSILYFEPSLPSPDCLTPPNGATSVEIRPSLISHHARLKRFHHSPCPVGILRVDVASETKLAIIAHANHVFFCRESCQRSYWAKYLLLHQACIR